MQVADYIHFGGKHGESAALKNLLVHAGVSNPSTGAPLTEASLSASLVASEQATRFARRFRETRTAAV